MSKAADVAPSNAEADAATRADLERRLAECTGRLEAANRELELFAHAMSHDLRAPLRAINGFAQIVMDDCAPRLPETARRHLRLIGDSARRMNALIEDLAVFVRIQQRKLDCRSIDTAGLVAAALEELGSPWPDRLVEVRLGALPESYGDWELLRLAWTHLLSNALKFTRRRKSARIEIGSAEVEGERAFVVRDNGIGFDPSRADRLFGLYQRLHGPEECEGNGIGLAIVQRIVARHGGRIWARALENRGAAFYFTLGGRSSAGRGEDA